MTGTTLSPRPDLVTELTAGQELPLAAVGAEQLNIILETVTRVWLDLMRDQPTSLDLDEAEINMVLAARLNNLRSSDPLWTQLVSTVARGVESISFDGAHLERRPDLSIFLTGRHPSFPIVVECKLIDRSTFKGADLYCRNGLARFVEGQYAWSNREAVMIAYVRDDSTLEAHLAPLLKRSMSGIADPWHTRELPIASPGALLPTASSSHGRPFVYPRRIGGNTPGDIAIWHLWLRGNSPQTGDIGQE